MLTAVPPGKHLGCRRFSLARIARPGRECQGYVQYLSFDLPPFFRLLVVKADVVVSELPPTTGLDSCRHFMVEKTPLLSIVSLTSGLTHWWQWGATHCLCDA